jgi:hypothetical protein
MDAMDAYGSDESDNDVLSTAGESQETDEKKSKKKSGLAGLLGDYSDDNDDDDGVYNEIQSLQTVKQGAAKAMPSDETSRKRQRRWDSPKNAGSDEAIPSASVSLPFPPPLTSNDRFMIEWNEDYVTAKQTSRTGPLKKVTSEKLQQISLETSWAQQLKKQHDFHNPHFFESVVEQFGIRDEMGSNLPNEEQFAEWEFDLMKYEEQARVQEQAQYQQEQNAAAPSNFAQQQLERAMQQS